MSATPRTIERRRRANGFSYIEVVVAVALVALALRAAMEGLSTGILGAAVHAEATESEFHLASRLEEVLADSFDALDAEAIAVGSPTVATAYSDPAGAAGRRLVYLARYDLDDDDGDGDPFTGGEDDVLWVRVALEHTPRALVTLTTR